MAATIYKTLYETLAKRKGRYPALDIPEFYTVMEELFTAEEAETYCAIPRGFSPASTIAESLDKPEDEVAAVLESMADKGLCTAGTFENTTFYGAPLLVPGIFEFQFMRGTNTEKDKKLAKLVHEYKNAVDNIQGPPKETYPTTRVITVDKKIEAGNTIHTYDQVAEFIAKYEPISVSTCFCRQEAKLVDPDDHCGKPDEVCMQFGMGAQFIIDRNMGRKVTKDEALKILQLSEEAGLVHASANRQDIDFLCNCCKCHCMILKDALAQPTPGIALNSGFQPIWDDSLCNACENCIENCPTEALSMSEKEVPEVNLDQCIGCGVCAYGCSEDAILLVARKGIEPPPLDRKALREAIKTAGS